jgi:quercetin dioxygenase-like cupin family protein
MERPLDPAVAAANVVRPVLENARVRVFEAHFAPGVTASWHTHPDHILHSLTDANFNISLPEGKEQDLALRAGETRWMEDGVHAVLNTGKNEARLLVIELK